MITIKKKDWIEILLHVVFWVGVFFTVLSLTQLHVRMPVEPGKDASIERQISFPRSFLMLGFLMLLFYGNTLWLFNKVARYKNVLVRIILPVCWFGMLFLANYYADRTLLSAGAGLQEIQGPRPPATKMGPVADRVIMDDHADKRQRPIVFREDSLSITIWFVFIIVFGLSVAYFFLKEWNRAEKLRSQLAAAQLDTEVKFLRSQVNPHFLFNTLNNLFSMAQSKGNDELADGISKLSGMMRYMLYDSNAAKVSLDTEIGYLEEFIALNKLRYADDEVVVKLSRPSKKEGVHIAPMLFIPFVENAFKHGVAIGRNTTIAISISISGQTLIFDCENPDHGGIRKMDADKSGIGLENVQRRLELLYPQKHRLQITASGELYKVHLEISLA